MFIDRARSTRLALLSLLACSSCSDGGSAGTTEDSASTGQSTGPATINDDTAALPTTGTTTGADDTTGGPSATGSDSDSSDDDSEGSSSSGEPSDPKPPAPDELVRFVIGNPDDADVEPTGPGLVLMGGSTDVDDAFAWWGDYISGGDVVVIRTRGSDGYNQYLYDFGNADSVETMLVTSEALAHDPYVTWTLRHAEAIWMAGGDQATYLDNWMGTPLEHAIEYAWSRGAVVGGTSAGLAVLGEFMFAAYNDTVYSDEALEDPYNQYMTMEQGFLDIPMMAGIITDSHFGERDRMGRLVGFLARIHADGWANDVTGIGVDERTAVVVGPDGQGTVIGQDNAYVVHAGHPPEVCMPGVALEYSGLEYHALPAGSTLSFPGALTPGMPSSLAASAGVTIPADPY